MREACIEQEQGTFPAYLAPTFCLVLFTLDLWESAAPAAPLSLSPALALSLSRCLWHVPPAHYQSEGILRKAALVAYSLLITSLMSFFCIPNLNPLPSMVDFASNDFVMGLQG